MAKRLETVNVPRMGLGNRLYSNIKNSKYFRKELYSYVDFNQVVDEIYNTVEYMEPWIPGTEYPSGAFTLVVKLGTMNLTVKQTHLLINHQDSPYIRGVGFVLLRLVHPPKQLWEWFSPFFEDKEEIYIGAKDKSGVPMAHFVYGLLFEPKFCGEVLPRIPVPIMRQMKKDMDAYMEENPDSVLADKHRSSSGGDGSRDRARSGGKYGSRSSFSSSSSSSSSHTSDRLDYGGQRGRRRDDDDYRRGGGYHHDERRGYERGYYVDDHHDHHRSRRDGGADRYGRERDYYDERGQYERGGYNRHDDGYRGRMDGGYREERGYPLTYGKRGRSPSPPSRQQSVGNGSQSQTATVLSESSTGASDAQGSGKAPAEVAKETTQEAAAPVAETEAPPAKKARSAEEEAAAKAYRASLMAKYSGGASTSTAPTLQTGPVVEEEAVTVTTVAHPTMSQWQNHVQQQQQQQEGEEGEVAPSTLAPLQPGK